jgi:hypothetical protein
MFPHPEDLHRLHQQQHAELIRNHTLERQARAALRPRRRLREIGLNVFHFILSRRWWRGITAPLTHHNHRDRSVTTALRNGALPIITPPMFPLGPPATAPSESTRR